MTLGQEVTLITELGDFSQIEDCLVRNGVCDTENMRYDLYLLTPQWKTIRRLKLEQAGHKCQVCASKNNLQIHHNTYDRRGRERLDDLTVLCNQCHELYETSEFMGAFDKAGGT